MALTSILVVEDENIVAKDIVSRLKNLGYAVPTFVASGEEAIAAAGQHRPDLVLMDIMLRGEIDGVEAARQILDQFDIPVIYLTAYADEKTLQRAKVTEAFGYLLKPFEERELHITIEMSLYKHTMGKKLRESEQHYRAVVQQSADAIYILQDERLVFVNPAWEKLFGYAAEEATSPGFDILSYVAPESVPLVQQRIASRRTGGPVSPRYEMRGKRRDGTVADLDVSLVEITWQGKPALQGIYRDITDRKRSEQALRESEEHYRRFFEEDLSGDYIAQPDGTLRACNPAFARIFGFASVEEALKCNVNSLYPDRAACERFYGLLRERRKLENFEKELLRANGTPIHVVENAVGTFDEAGELLEFKGYLFDNTERKLLEEQLRQSQKMESIGTLASGIAHDFNNVLNNVLGFAMQLKKFTNDEVKVRKYSETIEKSATRGAELASQLLSFARMTKRANVPTDIAHVIDEVVSNCALAFPANISIEKKVDPDLLHVLGDHGELFQVLMNLSGNARDAINGINDGTRGGKVVIEAHNAKVGEDISPQLFVAQGGECVELLVCDDGAGIPKGIRDKIYDPFFTTKERGRGTGLGLSIVYNIIRNYHGTIVVDSEEGKGTTFRIYLPAVQPKIVAQEEKKGVQRNTGKNRTILLVDDEAAMQELGKELLLEQGFQVVIANDGLEAVDIYRRRHDDIALVILDLVMPRMDGGQAYVEMKKINKDIKAFFCTGFISDRVIAGLLEEERLKVISKPFRPDDFVLAVAEVLDGQR